MSKKCIAIHILLLLLFLGLVTGCLVVQRQKAALYYPSIMEADGEPCPFLKERFHLVRSMDLIPNGNRSAGKGDFVLLPEIFPGENGAVSDPDTVPALAEKLAGQGAACRGGSHPLPQPENLLRPGRSLPSLSRFLYSYGSVRFRKMAGAAASHT